VRFLSLYFLKIAQSSQRAFLIQIPATILAIISVSVSLKLPSSDKGDFFAKLKRVDFAGAATLVAMIFALLLGLDRGGNVSWNDKFAIMALSAFAILFILFGVIEMKLASEPVAPKRIVTDRGLITTYMVNFFSGGALISMLFHTSLYLQAVLGKTPSQTGLFLIPAIAGSVVGSLVGGLMMQKSGKYYWLTVGAYLSMVIGAALVVLFTGILGSSPSRIATGMLLPVADGILS
jgi:predicted MFS family arabinose efflux permease